LGGTRRGNNPPNSIPSYNTHEYAIYSWWGEGKGSGRRTGAGLRRGAEATLSGSAVLEVGFRGKNGTLDKRVLDVLS